MIRTPGFWQTEGDAPLLTRNHDMLKDGDNDKIFERVAKWPALLGIEASPVITPKDPISKALQIMLEDRTTTITVLDPEKNENVATITALGITFEKQSNPYDEEFDRIAVKDAIRTFRGKDNQKQMIGMLHRLYAVFQDYHQALGYVCSFLSLTIDEETVMKMLLRIGRDDKYVPGYWKTFPEAYARDAMVYERLLEQSHPKLAKHLRSAGVVPEAYVSKWFIGCCIHVLPFPSLFDFFEGYLAEGYMFLFKWGIAICETLQDKLLATPATDVSKLFAILRLDAEHYPDELEATGFFKNIVALAKTIELPREVVDAYRATQWDALQERLLTERMKTAKLKEEDSDDEIIFSDEEEDEDEDERLRRLAEEN